MAQLVEHNLAKVGVAGSSPVVRSIWAFSSGGERFPDTEEVRSSNLLTPTKCSQLRGFASELFCFIPPSQKDAAAPKTTSTAPITIPDKTDAAPAPLVTIPTGPQAVSMQPQQTQPSPQLPKQPQRAPRSGPNGPRCHIRTTPANRR